MSLWSWLKAWGGYQDAPLAESVVAAPAIIKTASVRETPAYQLARRPDVQEKAMERALELRADDLTYEEIARRLGNLFRPGEIRRWCEEWDASQPPPVEALPNSTIMGLFGGKGSGKSLTATGTAWDYYQEGIPIYYNPAGLLKFPPIEGGICEFASLRDIILRADQLRDCLVVLDELQVNLSKYRTSTKASVLIRGVIQQVRKLGMDIVVTSNSPSQIDAGFAEQLDFHAFCKAHLPPEDPRDYIDLHWCDTQSFYGRGSARGGYGTRADTRMRFGETLWPASDLFQLYDHSVQVDPLEVMGLTAEEIAMAKEEKELGLNVVDVANFCREFLIPDMIREYQATSLVPTRVAEVIASSHKYARGFDHMRCCQGISTQEVSEHGCKQGEIMPLMITPALLGRALSSLGLPRRGATKAYILPEQENLAKWAAGAWAPGE
jgi:hypothetical protein